MTKIVQKISIALFSGLLGFYSNLSIAREFTADECLICSEAGLHVKYADDDSYWVAIKGMAAFDNTYYMGNYRDRAVDPASGSNPVPGIFRAPDRAFPSSAHIRSFILGIGGGLGPDWTYVLSFRAVGKAMLFDDSYLTYNGLCEGLRLSVGHVPGSFFGFENSHSINWIPFLERSGAADAFDPGEGLGVMARYGWCDGSILITAFQPGLCHRPFDVFVLENSIIRPSHNLVMKRDYWTTTGRFTFAPVHNECDVYHFGISAMWREEPTTIQNIPVFGKRLRAFPDSRGRALHDGLHNTTARLVDTGHIRANYIRQFNIEFARQWGALVFDAEYTTSYVHRIGDLEGALSFAGWNLEGRYMLTGEHLLYEVEYGNFCSLVPNGFWGAVELAARYDVVNLNNKNLFGGREHNATVGLNWYLNENVRFSLNYVRANIHPGSAAAIAENMPPNTFKRKLDIIAARAAVRF